MGVHLSFAWLSQEVKLLRSCVQYPNLLFASKFYAVAWFKQMLNLY